MRYRKKLPIGLLWAVFTLSTAAVWPAGPGPRPQAARSESTVDATGKTGPPAPDPSPDDVPRDRVPDLDRVEGIGRLQGPPAARTLLARNGFVVVPKFFRQIFSPYLHSGLPAFVTVDSLHRTFHVIFEEQLKTVETHLGEEVASLTAALGAGMTGLSRKPGGSPEYRQAISLARRYLLVAACLLDGSEAPPAADSAVVDELRRIRAAGGIAPSPLFGYSVDYSLFKPRGFYESTPALSRHFHVMNWYGLMTFRLASDQETIAALVLANLLGSDPVSLARWQRIDTLYTRLVAPSDDLTPEEYHRAMQDVSIGRGLPPVTRFRERARTLRDPAVNGMVLAPEQMPHWRELVKGMRLFGQRRVPDAEILRRVCDPDVPGRFVPSGLDVMAVLGSRRAADRTVLQSGNPRAHADALRKAAEVTAAWAAALQPSHYVQSLELVRTLIAPPSDAAPAFMHTPAYADKNLVTALAAWTSLRHAWALQAKGNETSAGETLLPPAGFVEPNFVFLDGLHHLVRRTVDIFGNLPGIDVARLETFDRLVLDLTAVARSMSRGAALSGPQEDLLTDYGKTLARLCYFEGNCYESEEYLPWMALVADVATETQSAQCLEEAVGPAMPIYVVVRYKGRDWLMAGGVYSHYEFLQPLGDRLTDRTWQERVHEGRVPAPPAWTASYIPGFDVGEIVRLLDAGKVPDDVLCLDDPELETALRRAILRSRESADRQDSDRDHYFWRLYKAYARKAGPGAVPLLMEEITRSAPGTPRQADGRNQRSSAACYALRGIIGIRDLPALEKLTRGPDRDLAKETLELIGSVEGPEADALLFKLYRQGPRALRQRALDHLGYKGNPEAIPLLIDQYPFSDEIRRQRIIQMLVWRYPELVTGPQEAEPAAASPGVALRRRLHRRVVSIVAQRLSQGEFDEETVDAARLIDSDRLIGVLERLAARPDGFPETVEGLIRLDSDRSHRALLRLLLNPPVKDRRQLEPIVTHLAGIRYEPALRAFRRLLDDVSLRGFAAGALAVFHPDGPGALEPDPPPENAELLADCWKLYLDDRTRDPGLAEDTATAEAFADRLRRLVERQVRMPFGDWYARVGRWLRLALDVLPRVPEPRRSEILRSFDPVLTALAKQETFWIVDALERWENSSEGCPVSEAGWVHELLEGRGFAFDMNRLTPDDRYLDPWGRPYRYRCPGRDKSCAFEVWSAGPDGIDNEGTGDDPVCRRMKKLTLPMIPRVETIWPPLTSPGEPTPPTDAPPIPPVPEK